MYLYIIYYINILTFKYQNSSKTLIIDINIYLLYSININIKTIEKDTKNNFIFIIYLGIYIVYYANVSKTLLEFHEKWIKIYKYINQIFLCVILRYI